MIAPPARAIEVAREAAVRSPCAKSKRGAVLFWADERTFRRPIVREATASWNGPTEPWICDASKDCRDHCGATCMHAEARCISSALMQGIGRGVRRSAVDDTEPLLYQASNYDLVHVKVAGPVVVPGGGPSCIACSKAILEFGCAGVWLFEKYAGQSERWRRYTAVDFHQESLRAPKNNLLLAAERLVR